MRYLDEAALDAVATRAFREQAPFPWANPEGLLTARGFALLRSELPPQSAFAGSFGRRRAHGQTPHDRFVLEYREDLAVPVCWHEFVDELRGEAYGDFLRRLLGVRSLWLSFHWHYTPAGCSVSPHCDALRKLGSHIFYFNAEDDWDPTWGGETVMLEDRVGLSRRSAPDFGDFAREFPARTLGNRSVLFQRTAHSWHGVRPIRCPEGALRKVFIVVINRMRAVDRARRVIGLPLAASY